MKTGDRVYLLPAFQDAGDSDYQWVAVSDPDKGRVDISPINTEMAILPVYTVRLEWLA